jgi:hypothetical protein
VRENVPDIDDLPPVFDYRDEPILVSTDIKHGEVIHSVSVREVLSNVRQMPPGGAFRDHIPVQKRFESTPVPRAEFRNRRLADDPHIRCYQYGNQISTSAAAPGAAHPGMSHKALYRTDRPVTSLRCFSRGGFPRPVPERLLFVSQHGPPGLSSPHGYR